MGGVALASIACSAAETSEDLRGRGFAIYGGVESGPEDDFVVRLESVNAVGLRVDCTAVAVAPRLVLTARHCVVHTHPPPFLCGSDGELVTTTDGGKFGAALEPKNVNVYVGPGYPLDVKARGTQMFTTDTATVCRDDIAFLVLDTPLDVPPVPLRLIDPVTPGEPVSVIGYGFGDPGATQLYRKRAEGLVVESVGPEQVDPADFSQTPPRSFAVGRSTCPGDSGGPAISEETGAVLGVASLSSSDCALQSVRNFFPRLAPHAKLAGEAFAAAGEEPWIEGAAPPGSSESCSDCEESGCTLARGRSRGGVDALLLELGLLTRRARGASRRRGPR
jgi:hypothetical protein